MLETLLERPSSLNRHRESPLLKEREEFLRRLQRRNPASNHRHPLHSIVISAIA
jgi:hypothetical protein